VAAPVPRGEGARPQHLAHETIAASRHRLYEVPIPPQRAAQRMDLYLYIVLLNRLAGPAPLHQLRFRDQQSGGVDQRQ